MSVHKLRQVHESDTKVYNCTFQLHLYELRILLKFPCKFFIEWKTVNGSKSIKTQGLIECINGKVQFNQNLLIETQMLYNINRKQWLRKVSTISVYLITRSKPDFNQIAGRINIDLSLAMQNNPYHQILTESLTHASTSADLKFSLQTKYSLQSQKPIKQVDLLQFSDRLLYIGKGNDQISKSKSMGYLKVGHPMISPVYQVNSASQIHVGKIDEDKPLHFPKMKLENLGHQVFQSVEMQSNHKNSQGNEFNIRMTLGPSKKHLSRQDYELMIDQQTKGMKKSDLMVVPDMKKSGIEQDDSQFNTQRSKKQSQDQFPITHNDYRKEKIMRKAGSQKKTLLARPQSPQSQIDINFDTSEALLESRQLHENKSNGVMIKNVMINSMNSSNSFSVSRFQAQFQSSGPQNFSKIKSIKQSTISLNDMKKEILIQSTQKNSGSRIQKQNEYTSSRVNKLQNEIHGLTRHLADNRERSQNLQDQLTLTKNNLSKFEEQNKELNKKIIQLQKKTQYESKINLINCQKLKKVSSELSIERSRMRSSQNSYMKSQVQKLRSDLIKSNQALKKTTLQNESLKSKLQQRDEIELQNEIRIQELQQLLEKQKSLNKNFGGQSSNFGFKSKVTKKQTFATQRQSSEISISYFEEKIKVLQGQNQRLKQLGSQKDQIFAQKTLKIQNQLVSVEKEFQNVIFELSNKERLLLQKINEVELWKTKSYAASYSSSAQQQIKNRSLQQELKKQKSLIESYQLQLQQYQKQIQKLTSQNHELAQNYQKFARQSYRFEGQLKVIKEEQSFRQSFASSGGFFNMSGSHGLNFKQENAIHSFKETIQKYNQKLKKSQKVQIQFLPDINDIRRKIFRQIERATNVIAELLMSISTLQQEIFGLKQEKLNSQNQNRLKLQKMHTKINELQQNERISAGSSNIMPLASSLKTSQNQKFDQYSQSTKKKSLPLNMSTLSVQTKLTREVQKLKSIIYDKNKEISDLIASYEKLKLQKQTQSMLFRSKRTKSLEKQSLQHEDDDQSDAELVHDILDLQIRLNKQKQKKNLIMQELQLRKSLNRSQQISQNVPQFDLSSVYKEIRAIITSRQNYITTEDTLQRLVIRINQIHETSRNRNKQKNQKLTYLMQEKSRTLSKQLQVMKSALLKLNTKGLESMQCKTFIANSFKPAQNVMNELIGVIEQMIDETEE